MTKGRGRNAGSLTDRDPARLHLDGTDLSATTALLTRWAAAQYGPGATVDRVAPISRHRGSLGFDVRTGTTCERLVIGVTPAEVPRGAPGDVLHKVPVLRAAALSGVPVPTVRWWSDDEHWFGSPFIVVERLPGGSPDATAIGAERLLDEAVPALAAIHRIDWRRRLPNWSQPRSLDTEIRPWEPALRGGAAWTTKGLALEELLLRSRPAEPEPAVRHGDFSAKHWVCDGDRLLGVVGWDLAAVGPSLLDVGWLMMVHDPACRPPIQRAEMTWEPAEVADAYQAASGRLCPDLAWYQALACWRMAAIAARNAALPRTGAQADETAPPVGGTVEPLVERGLALLSSASGQSPLRLGVS